MKRLTLLLLAVIFLYPAYTSGQSLTDKTTDIRIEAGIIHTTAWPRFIAPDARTGETINAPILSLSIQRPKWSFENQGFYGKAKFLVAGYSANSDWNIFSIKMVTLTTGADYLYLIKKEDVFGNNVTDVKSIGHTRKQHLLGHLGIRVKIKIVSVKANLFIGAGEFLQKVETRANGQIITTGKDHVYNNLIFPRDIRELEGFDVGLNARLLNNLSVSAKGLWLNTIKNTANIMPDKQRLKEIAVTYFPTKHFGLSFSAVSDNAWDGAVLPPANFSLKAIYRF